MPIQVLINRSPLKNEWKDDMFISFMWEVPHIYCIYMQGLTEENFSGRFSGDLI